PYLEVALSPWMVSVLPVEALPRVTLVAPATVRSLSVALTMPLPTDSRLSPPWMTSGKSPLPPSEPRSNVRPGLRPVGAAPLTDPLPPMTGTPEVEEVWVFSTPTKLEAACPAMPLPAARLTLPLTL